MISNNRNDHDSLPEDVVVAVTDAESLLNEETLPHLLRDDKCKQALVRLYSVLLEVDIRNNPERYL